MITLKECDWGFYEAKENGSRASMADYYETLRQKFRDLHSKTHKWKGSDNKI